ncbi:sodium:proton antiporter [Acidihalobacter yilgarnensis]|uniref:Sodium:proton antiporter n=1 Tax=Acidihalobacter yilgarnensis TaxID=2819280 RepID=A0A1D8IS05_9GAMM|nr:sodium:proton antiporter NhaD [Acidihalobacter yilgarnensis]AOU99246.1 sodium:proton antiporter [Acidihalobacter yilgarnensis]
MKSLPAFRLFLVALFALLLPTVAQAAEAGAGGPPVFWNLTGSWYGMVALLVFVLAYLLVVAEEALHLRKSKPVMIAAAVIWVMVPLAYAAHGNTTLPQVAIRENLLEYVELMLFLLAAMTYINTMQERGVFDVLRGWLVSRGFSLRTIFWITGLLAFFISPVADNLTTALLMAAVVMAVARDNPRFVVLACINIVVAANAGGAFSPFGDITTLMVWQRHMVTFTQFFDLFLPAVVNWLVPAAIMSFAVPHGRPRPMNERVVLRPGGAMVIVLFFITIASAVAFHQFLHMPPMLGMMAGLGLLKLYGYRIKMRERRALAGMEGLGGQEPPVFDVFAQLQRAEWDTLMFFYGVILCVGGLAALGYLALVSEALYSGLGATPANVIVGLLSALVDNIPVMYAVLTMQPDMSHGQWLLVTLTAGVGGSLLSIGSAAGVGLMGQARGIYTFSSHLRWTWAVALGYAASILVHLWLNADLMHLPAGGG